MRPVLLPALAALLALQGACPALAPAADLDGDLEEALARTAGAARGFVLDDRAVVLAELDAADDAAAAAEDAALAESGFPPSRLLRRIWRFRERILQARSAAAFPGYGARRVAAILRRAVKAGFVARRALDDGAIAGFDLRISGGGFRPAGRRMAVRLMPGDGGPCETVDSAAVVNDGPGTAVEEEVEDLGRGRLRLRMGPDAGSATLTITACGATRSARLFNLGPPGALAKEPGWGDSGAAPTALLLSATEVSWRAGAAAPAFAAAVEGGHPAEFSFGVDPALPAGLSLDPATGAIAGTPEAEAFAADFEVSASNLHGVVSATVRIEVTPALPPEVEFLADGFAAEPWLEGLAVPVKMAPAPDGRLFFNELATGNVRVVAADGTLLETPFATVAVQTGVERGLLGLALAPDFGTSGHLFVYAVVPPADPKPFRGQVIRFTATGDVGGSPTVILDDIPAGLVQNGGDLQFGPDGKLYLSIGDTGDSSLAQADGERAGRVLRFEPGGSIPADNPFPGDPEFCRGLRNPFDMAFHGPTGGLYATENGPTAGDEVNFLLAGRNYGWEVLPDGYPPSQVGPRIAYWGPVIVPTGLVFHSGEGFGAGYAGDLFLCTYDEAELRRLVLSGPSHTDLDSQSVFVRWDDSGGVDNKPLDAVERADGSLLVSTFTGIWRIDRFASRQE